MRCMNRNKRPIWYALYAGRQSVQDEWGNETGESKITYDDPVLLCASVSCATGNTETLVFGNNLDYDRVIILEKPILGLDEQSVLWIDTDPKVDADGKPTVAYDYVVKRISSSINNVSVAVRKVTVDD